MHSKIITPAAALLAIASVANATGHISIANNCDFPVYWNNVAGDASFSEFGNVTAGMVKEIGEYRYLNGVGVSLKMAAEDFDVAPGITQFEYTFMQGDWAGLWYDASNIDGEPFQDHGLLVVPSQKSCRKIACKPGVETCNAVYNVPSDNSATNICSVDSNMMIHTCGTAPANGAGEGSAPAPAPAPVEPAPAPPVTLVTVAAAPTETWNVWHHPIGWSQTGLPTPVPRKRHVHHHNHHHHA